MGLKVQTDNFNNRNEIVVDDNQSNIGYLLSLMLHFSVVIQFLKNNRSSFFKYENHVKIFLKKNFKSYTLNQR